MDNEREAVFVGNHQSLINVEKKTLTWTIKNFDLVRKCTYSIRKEKFPFEAGHSIALGSEWCLYLKVDEFEEVEYVSVFLELNEWPVNVKEVYGCVQMTIMKKTDGHYLQMGNLRPGGMKEFTTKNWGYRYVMQKDAEKEDLPLIDGDLVVKWELHLYAPSPKITAGNGTDFVEPEFKEKFIDKLQSDYVTLLNNPPSQIPDSKVKVKIVSKDGKEFGVLGNILSVRSPVFDKMLTTNTQEAEATGIILMTDLSSKTVSVLIHFINTGTLRKDWSSPDVIVQLVYAADKYELKDLIEFLENKVCSKETVPNSEATLSNQHGEYEEGGKGYLGLDEETSFQL